MGSMLQAAGLPEGMLPDVWGMESPTAVQAVHRAYLEAGSRLITTNTFGTCALKLAPYGVTPEQVMTDAVAHDRAAMDQAGVSDAYVCADIGPTGKLLRPYGDLDFEDAVALFAETVRAAVKAGADCIPKRAPRQRKRQKTLATPAASSYNRALSWPEGIPAAFIQLPGAPWSVPGSISARFAPRCCAGIDSGLN